MSRKPNQGPYVVSYRDALTGKVEEREAQTWSFACAIMRELLIANCQDVSVRYA